MSVMQGVRRIAPALVIALTPLLASAQRPPASGSEVLERMRQKYAKSWYPSLTFSQQTTRFRNGTPTVQTWFESLQYFPGGAKLRIDFDKPAKGNGVLYTADSSWTMRHDTLVATDANGNPFIPLIENVYLQPVDVTVAELAPLGIDMNKVASGSQDGRPVWIVGAATPSDTTSPQFRIDAQRLALVRMILRLAPNRPPYDIHLDNLVPIGGGWLATKVTMYANGSPAQIEEYADWKANVKLDPGLFSPDTWGTARHWVAP